MCIASQGMGVDRREKKTPKAHVAFKRKWGGGIGGERGDSLRGG